MSTVPLADSMAVTIAVCTRNRAHLLARTLDALQTEIGAYPTAELLVVDNSSMDETAQVVRERSTIRYVVEPTLGIAYARNRAAHEAQGGWLIYVDDDAVPVHGWFSHMLRAIREQDAACVLGKVDLEWEGGRANWFPPEYESLLSRYDLGDVGHYVGYDGYLLTTNTAFDRNRLIAVGGFRRDLGHRGKNLLGGEDNDIFNRLTKANCPVWYAPGALVKHWVPRERQTRRWLFRRVFWDGATQPLLDYGAGCGRRRYLSEMGRDIRRVLRLTIQHGPSLFKATGRRDLSLEWTRQIGRLWMNWRLLRG